MDRKEKIGSAVSLLLLASVYVLLWIFLPDPVQRYLIFSFVVLLFLTGAVRSWYLKKKAVQLADSICETIDGLKSGKEVPSFSAWDGGMDTRVKEKLYEYHEVIEAQQQDNRKAKQTIQEIISDIAHQVRTPIANVRIYTDILCRHELPREKKEEFTGLLEAQVDKLDFLMQSMIKMSRLETGIVMLSPRCAPVIGTLTQAMNLVLMKAEEKQIELSVEADESLCAVHDVKWTAEALGNILDNAVKYTPERGNVSVRARRWEYYVRIDITDNGIGIDEEHYHDIFKRFYRALEVADEEGVGIGLYLAREIITYEKGYISVKSARGKGSTFSVYLPAEQEI